MTDYNCDQRNECENYRMLCLECIKLNCRRDNFAPKRLPTGWKCAVCEYGPCYKMSEGGITSGGNPQNDNLCLMTHGGYLFAPQITAWKEFFGKVVD